MTYVAGYIVFYTHRNTGNIAVQPHLSPLTGSMRYHQVMKLCFEYTILRKYQGCKLTRPNSTTQTYIVKAHYKLIYVCSHEYILPEIYLNRNTWYPNYCPPWSGNFSLVLSCPDVRLLSRSCDPLVSNS